MTSDTAANTRRAVHTKRPGAPRSTGADKSNGSQASVLPLQNMATEPTVQRAAGGDLSSVTSETGDRGYRGMPVPISSSQREDDLAELVALIEDRVLTQLERRGGRYHGAF